MKSLFIILTLVAVVLSTPLQHEISRRDVESDAEFIGQRATGTRSPGGVIIDIPAGGDDDFDEDEDEFGFGSRFGIMDDPRYGYNPFLYWRRRMSEINRFFNMLFNRPRPVYPTFTFGDFDEYPPEYSNSTITTKVVNGSVITINETITKHQSHGNSFFIHTKTVHVRPENETVTTDVQTTVAPETVTRVTEPRVEQEATSTISTSENDSSNDVNSGRAV